MRWLFLAPLLAVGCTTYLPQGAGVGADADRLPPGYDPACEAGTHCNPHLVDAFPFVHAGDTSASDERHIDEYSCSSSDEGGAEVWYAVDVTEAGRLVASIDEVSGDGIDVDVHILDGTTADSCLARDNETAQAQVEPGFVWVVVDTWTSSGGTEYDGPYELTLDFVPDASIGSGSCAVEASDLRMYWSSCASGIDCYTSGGDTYLQLPTTGPVVKEAHLVTVDDGFGSSWPSSYTDDIDDHYALSEAATGYVMSRTEPWAPAGEGGSEYGQSATAAPLPVLDEAWYITMYWKDRPDKGTRMIVRNPANGRAVVASAGWETGPGSNEAVAGVSEEIHHYLGTTHLDDLEVGFAVDQGQALGPVVCGSGGTETETEPSTGTETEPSTGTETESETTPGSEPCPAGVVCVDALPYTDSDSTTGEASVLDGYACAPDTDESGPEVVYQLELDESGFLGAALSGLGSGVDVDVHILEGTSAGDCVDRGHWEAGALLPPGTYYVVVDSWVSSSGTVMDGSYTLDLNLTTYDDFTWAGLDPAVLEAGLYAFDRAWLEGDLDKLIYGIVDYSRPSTEERFWVVDLATGDLLYSELTSHGIGSQDASDMTMADTFSNVSGSNASSIGLARAAETYWGSNGYSMRLDGLEGGWNSNDRSRAIVVHAADYATESFANSYGYLGRSWGCPALDPAVNDDIIDTLSGGGGLFKYYPDNDWLSDSYYLQDM